MALENNGENIKSRNSAGNPENLKIRNYIPTHTTDNNNSGCNKCLEIKGKVKNS